MRCLNMYGLDIFVFVFKLLIFICGFSAKVTCTFLASKKQWRNIIRVKHFSTRKNSVILHRSRVKGSIAFKSGSGI